MTVDSISCLSLWTAQPQVCYYSSRGWTNMTLWVLVCCFCVLFLCLTYFLQIRPRTLSPQVLMSTVSTSPSKALPSWSAFTTLRACHGAPTMPFLACPLPGHPLYSSSNPFKPALKWQSRLGFGFLFCFVLFCFGRFFFFLFSLPFPSQGTNEAHLNQL